MHELETFHELVENVPVMGVFEDLLTDSVVQVGLHKFEHEIKILVVLCSDDIVQLDDIWVGEFMQKDDFPVGSLGVGGVLKGIEYFFESHDLIGFFISNFPHVSIGTASNLFDEIVSL